MKRINTATAVDGMFVDGNRALGQKATQLSLIGVARCNSYGFSS